MVIEESQIAGRKFRYRAADRAAPRMTLRPDHRLDGAPSIHEHAWKIEGDKLLFFHRDGRKTAEFTAAGTGKYAGIDLTTTPASAARLIERRRGALHRWTREFKYAVLRKQRPQTIPLTREQLLNQSIGVRLGNKTIRWIFQFRHDRDFLLKYLLAWALPDHRPLPTEAATDFVVGVYLNDGEAAGSFAELPGDKFLLSCEKETRFPRLQRCHAFVQNPLPTDDPAYVRYAPTFCQWAPPRSENKSAKCSVVDNGQYVWRAEMIRDLAIKIGDVNIFGKLSGRRLGGYHRSAGGGDTNDKYLGIESHCFYLSLERALAPDYLTEKFTDAILCEAIPIYDGCPNIDLYALPDSFIPAADVAKIDWQNWQAEYQRRLPALLAQKEILRTRLNVFSYFHLLTDDLSRLDRPRPITREG